MRVGCLTHTYVAEQYIAHLQSVRKQAKFVEAALKAAIAEMREACTSGRRGRIVSGA